MQQVINLQQEISVDYEVTEASDGGTEVILGSPFKFDPSNIDEWKDVY